MLIFQGVMSPWKIAPFDGKHKINKNQHNEKTSSMLQMVDFFEPAIAVWRSSVSNPAHWSVHPIDVFAMQNTINSNLMTPTLVLTLICWCSELSQNIPKLPCSNNTKHIHLLKVCLFPTPPTEVQGYFLRSWKMILVVFKFIFSLKQT